MESLRYCRVYRVLWGKKVFRKKGKEKHSGEMDTVHII